MDLKPIGKPVNLLVKLSEDILPSPEALLVTGITPQKVAADGISEPEFAKFLNEEVFLPNTTTVGFNNIRFDDEFIRHLLWRNFYDPYEWAYSDGRSRWDMLDVSRLVRALRPDGINWPVDKNGKPTNNLEALAKINKLEHIHSHDALSDVEALIALTRLIKSRRPEMFQYLFDIRSKKEIARLVNLDEPQLFVYASGRYDSDNEKTTVALPVAPGRREGTLLAYDMRADITEVNTGEQLPVKELAYNRCPAVLPLNAIKDEKTWRRINLDLKTVQSNLKKLQDNRGLLDQVIATWNDRPDWPAAEDVEGQLYDSFTPDADKSKIFAVRSANAEDLADLHPSFIDERLPELLFRYKARNFPQSLSEAEAEKWEEYRAAKLGRELPGYMNRLAQLAISSTSTDSQFLLEEIQLWVESIAPISD